MNTTRAPHLSVRRVALTAALLGAALGLATAGARGAAFSAHEVIVGYRTAPRAAATAAADLAAAHEDDGRALSVRLRPVVRSRVLGLPHGESVAAAIRRLRGRPGIAYAEPDYIAHAAGGPFYPDDEGRAHRAQGWESQQWNLLPRDGIGAPQAWANLLADGRAGGSGVRIAVLDTGVAYRDWHAFRASPDLRGTRFVAPHDFIADNRYPLDRDGHGTFVASMIAEATNNTIGLTGLAYGATIMPVRVLSSTGLGDESTIAEGIRYAVAHKAQIINLSLEFVPDQVHSPTQIPQVVSAIQYARRKGVMVVSAAGNDQQRQPAYPARVPGVVAVGATTEDQCLAAYSNVGSGIALVAPGGGSDAIMPSDPACHPGRNLPPIYQMTLSDPPHWSDFGYPSFYIGTSMSVPEVSGAAAMVIASGVIGRDPTPDQVLARLERTATPLPAGGRQPNPTYGWGLLNVAAATAPSAIPSLGR